MKTAVKPIPFAGSELGEIRHVFAFFNSNDEAYRVLFPFIKDGFAYDDKAIHVVNPDERHVHLRRLAATGTFLLSRPAARNAISCHRERFVSLGDSSQRS